MPLMILNKIRGVYGFTGPASFLSLPPLALNHNLPLNLLLRILTCILDRKTVHVSRCLELRSKEEDHDSTKLETANLEVRTTCYL
jgi:hypothetical protein